MSQQNTTYGRTPIQNHILDLEKKYMEILDSVFTSERFISDLKKSNQIHKSIMIYSQMFGERKTK